MVSAKGIEIPLVGRFSQALDLKLLTQGFTDGTVPPDGILLLKLNLKIDYSNQLWKSKPFSLCFKVLSTPILIKFINVNFGDKLVT